MTSRRLEGWLFDVDELGPRVALWVYTNENRLVRLSHEFQPPVYVQGESAKLKALSYELERRGIIRGVRWAERTEFWGGVTITVLELHVADASLLPKLRELAWSRDREFTFYNCDIPAAQHYLYLTGLFPLCRLACEVNEEGDVLEIAPTDSPWNADYKIPDLRVMGMRDERAHPLSEESCIVVECLGEQTRLNLGDGRLAIDAFNDFIRRHDPDIVLSEGGDSTLMPALLALARKEQTDLALDRDRVVTKRKIITEGRTYFGNGRVVHRGPSYPLFGRWHIDSDDSFVHRETELDGLIELSRLAKIPAQRMARTSPGAAMSSMQMDRAIKDGILIPLTRSEPEAYKTALELLTVDKGGLAFRQPVGGFEQVAEVDFDSMYPAIMARFNISPETVLCACCTNRLVPEANYNVCQRRRGLIPKTLEPLLERRKRHKKLMRECDGQAERDRYDSRQAAIKWMLVSCFGYLGYKNARFGRIEAHEATTAYGREKLLRAKEVAEAAGFRVLHALTDSLWVKREGTTEEDVAALCGEITEATGIEMSLEGIYDWIMFLPSKQNSKRGVACRYYGVFSDGEMKVRGLACRRSDIPRFIREAQAEMLSVLAAARSLKERARLMWRVEAVLSERMGELERGEVEQEKLMMKRKGIEPCYDAGEYIKILKAAAAEIMALTGDE